MIHQPCLLLVGVLLIFVAPVVVAFSSPWTKARTSSSLASQAAAASPSSSHRVFVGGLTTCDRALLQEDLETRYGPIDTMFLLRETSAHPFAFVDFYETADAAQAIASSPITTAGNDDQQHPESVLYRTIEAAKPQQMSSKSIQQKRDNDAQREDYQDKLHLAQTSTAIIQVHESHVNRLEQFLQEKSDLNGHDDDTTKLTDTAVVTGTCRKTSCRSVALLGAAQVDAAELQQWFQSLPFPLRGVNKVYSVDPPKRTVGTQSQALEHCRQEIMAALHPNEEEPQARWKLNVFPPSLLPDLIGYLEEHSPDELVARLSPQQSTHTLHLVHIPSASSAGKKSEHEQLWLMGVVANNHERVDGLGNKHKETAPVEAIMSNQYNANVICRAQSKLQEAFYRYKEGPLPDSMKATTTTKGGGGIAVDCGAAPGGWTQFIVDRTQCDRIYSIDPGDLDPAVAQHPTVLHLRSKVEDALGHIHNVLTKENEKASTDQQQYVKLWVSDMCLHQMSEQVDIFLKAQRMGVVGEGTFFVLTLKCRVGRSDEAFDEQVAVQCERLEATCRNMQTIHLFSNRSGERTIMGYAKAARVGVGFRSGLTANTKEEANKGEEDGSRNEPITDMQSCHSTTPFLGQKRIKTRREYLQFIPRVGLATTSMIGWLNSPGPAVADNGSSLEIPTKVPSECQSGALMAGKPSSRC